MILDAFCSSFALIVLLMTALWGISGGKFLESFFFSRIVLNRLFRERKKLMGVAVTRKNAELNPRLTANRGATYDWQQSAHKLVFSLSLIERLFHHPHMRASPKALSRPLSLSFLLYSSCIYEYGRVYWEYRETESIHFYTWICFIDVWMYRLVRCVEIHICPFFRSLPSCLYETMHLSVLPFFGFRLFDLSLCFFFSFFYAFFSLCALVESYQYSSHLTRSLYGVIPFDETLSFSNFVYLCVGEWLIFVTLYNRPFFQFVVLCLFLELKRFIKISFEILIIKFFITCYHVKRVICHACS